MVCNTWNMLLCDALNSETKLIGKCFRACPGIGWFEYCRMSNLLFKLFLCQITAMSFCKSNAILINVIAVCPLYLCNLVAATCNKGNHVDPEYILHTASCNSAVVFLCKFIQSIDLGCRSSPRVYSLFTCCDDVDSSCYTLLNLCIDIRNKRTSCYDSYICVTFIQNFVFVVAYDDSCLYSEFCPVAYILAHR